MNQEPIRVKLVDDHAMVRVDIRRFLDVSRCQWLYDEIGRTAH